MSEVLRVCYQDAPIGEAADQCSTWQRITNVPSRCENTPHRCASLCTRDRCVGTSLVFSRAPLQVETVCVRDQWRNDRFATPFQGLDVSVSLKCSRGIGHAECEDEAITSCAEGN